MKKLKTLKAKLSIVFLYGLSIMIASCDSEPQSKLYFTEYGSLLWVNNQMPDSTIKKAVEYKIENSSVIVAQVPWSPSDLGFMNNIDWYSLLAKEHGKGLMIHVDWLSNDRKSTRGGDWTFEAPSTREQFSKSIISMVEKYDPEFLNLGVEVNYYALISPEGYKAFISTFNSLKQTLKEKHPKLKIGLSFQLELLYGIDKKWVQAKTLQPLEAVAENLDFIGVSTYPDLSPNKDDVGLLSASYLDSIQAQFTIPIGISETGISSSVYNEDQRASYVKNVFAKSNRYLFVIWGSMIDPHENNDWMSRIGLLDSNAVPKKEYTVWRDGINTLELP